MQFREKRQKPLRWIAVRMNMPACFSISVALGLGLFIILFVVAKINVCLVGAVSLAATLVTLTGTLLLNRQTVLGRIRATIENKAQEYNRQQVELQRELQRVVKRSNRAERLVGEVSRAAHAFIESMNVEHQYVFFAVKYIVDSQGNDRWLRRYVIRAGLEPIRVLKGIAIGGQGKQVGEVERFDELSIAIRTDKGQAVFLPFIEQPAQYRRWEGAILFNPRIEPDERKILEVSGAWRGLWNDLRENGEDIGTLGISKSAQELNIEVAFPEEWELELVPIDYPNIERYEIRSAEDVKAKQRSLTWYIKNATTGNYTYKVLRKAPIHGYSAVP